MTGFRCPGLELAENGIFGRWCTNCKNLREQQNSHHPQDCNGDVQYGFYGGGARIVGLEFPKDPVILKKSTLILIHYGGGKK